MKSNMKFQMWQVFYNVELFQHHQSPPNINLDSSSEKYVINIIKSATKQCTDGLHTHMENNAIRLLPAYQCRTMSLTDLKQEM